MPQVWADAEDPHTVNVIDCEMVHSLTLCNALRSHSSKCMRMDGKVLTWVCVIILDAGKVVYDQLVKPPSPITDNLMVSLQVICLVPPTEL